MQVPLLTDLGQRDRFSFSLNISAEGEIDPCRDRNWHSDFKDQAVQR